ncbi:hypothetical protein FOTG_19193 [Fusarium oxysporum f. sp. vasinfectum 25433]|uniref:Uncharacterized protein n=1 Tax=Fusarium oxysporum f. sp. vasinfectum 25433 TaxID=1089449 RepID=X0KUH8_FUSOX|nr:hypothetical protein FOTG_19193 [Fusarium oxysporum f. sp. vasinfectum 25433]
MIRVIFPRSSAWTSLQSRIAAINPATAGMATMTMTMAYIIP